LSQKEPDNSKSPFKISDKLKSPINAAVDSNKTNAGVIVGLVDPNRTQFYGYGKISDGNNATVDQNTIFTIASNTKVFTAILLVDMVEDGLIKLDDPIEKYLPPNVTYGEI
jgi:CubicO group peptidase (beta-lactamase class C family)